MSTIVNLNDTLPRISKRKLDDAIQSLDNAVGSSESLVQPPPAKRPHTASADNAANRSLYSTLAKYGIKSKHNDRHSLKSRRDSTSTLTKSTPNLTAILSRTRKAIPFKFSVNTPPTIFLDSAAPAAEYRPSSISSFLSRLATFKLSTFANKPIDAVAASKCGWTNSGKDKLKCGICAIEWVVASREGMSRDAANALAEKQRQSLIGNHKDGCPWKTRQCDPTIYRIPLQSAVVMTRDIKSNALTLESLLQGVEIRHPLSSSQCSSLRAAVAIVPLGRSTDETEAEAVNPSDGAVLASLFGWSLAPAPPPPVLSRSNSGISTPRSPSVSSFLRIPSSSGISSGTSTPTISRPRPLIHGHVITPKRDTALLHCILCQRRVGLWAFAPAASSGSSTPTASKPQPTRQFDLLKEHRSYCPYVVRSTVVPSLPTTDKTGTSTLSRSQSQLMSSSSASQLNGQANGAVEGWRAVLTLVLRYGMGQRQRLGLVRRRAGDSSVVDVGLNQGDQEEEAEIDGVEAMVAGVKRKGGRELLKYVKGLLG